MHYNFKKYFETAKDCNNYSLAISSDAKCTAPCESEKGLYGLPAYSDHRTRSAQRDDGVASGTAATAEKKQMKNSNLLEFGNANRTCLCAQMTGGWARRDGDMLCC